MTGVYDIPVVVDDRKRKIVRLKILVLLGHSRA